MKDAIVPDSMSVTSPDCEGVVALIPAYNEDRFIASVVLKTRPFAAQVIVVDDGSSDQTAAVAAAAGALVVRHAHNRGKSAALNTGLEQARSLKPRAVVFIDGDGQHSPQDIPAVVAPVLMGQADIVVGSRFMGRHSRIPGWRRLGQHALTAATNLLSGQPLTDSQSGFRALSARAVERLRFSARGFSVESEMQFLARELGLSMREVPIGVVYAEPAKRNPLQHGLQILNGLLLLVGQSRPLLFFGVPGLVLLLAGLGLGWRVVAIYDASQQLAVGYALITVLLCVVGMLSLFSGLILHTMRGFFLQYGLRSTYPARTDEPDGPGPAEPAQPSTPA